MLYTVSRVNPQGHTVVTSHSNRDEAVSEVMYAMERGFTNVCLNVAPDAVPPYSGDEE